MESEKKIRTFLAIDLPEEIQNEIGKIQKRLKPKVEGVRWTRPEGVHLTLKFFGYVQGEDFTNIFSAVSESAEGVKPFTLEIGQIGAFPGPTRPRIIWIGISGESDRLVELQLNLDRKLEQIGFPTEERAFKPHLTLGRVKVPGSAVGFSKVLDEGRSYRAGSFRAEGLTLFRSDLRPDGAIYTRLEQFPFKK